MQGILGIVERKKLLLFASCPTRCCQTAGLKETIHGLLLSDSRRNSHATLTIAGQSRTVYKTCVLILGIHVLNSIFPRTPYLLPTDLVNSNTSLPQILLRLFDLLHKLFVRFGDIVEGEDAVAEFREEVCAEGYDGPERELRVGVRDVTSVAENIEARLTTGITSSWIFAGKGMNPRNALRYSCLGISIWLLKERGEMQAYRNQDKESGDVLSGASHFGFWICVK